MSFDSIEFAAFSIAVVVVLNLLRGMAARLAAILVVNLVFIASFVSAPEQAIPLAGFVAAGYAAVRVAPRVGARGLWPLIAAVVALFIWLKQYTIAGFLPSFDSFPYLTVGLSYILFRVLHLIVDANQGALRPPGPLAYLAYLLFFLTFVSGPIQRYEDFARQASEPALPRTVVVIDRAFNRIVLGLFLVAVVTQVTSYVFHHIEPRLYDGLSSGRFGAKLLVLYVGAAVGFLVHLYLNFVGYMHMVIGVGTLCGFALPENFDRPYLSKNFLDFWSRWHITLSNWFKFYIFNPTLKALAGRWGTPASMPYLGAVAFFVTFGIMGVWHGSTIVFVFYGLFLGLGVAINKLYQVEMARRLGRQSYRTLCRRFWYRRLSNAATIAYFAVALTCVWIPAGPAGAMATPLGATLGAAAFLVITGGFVVAGPIIVGIAALWRRLPPLGDLGQGYAAPVAVGVKLFVVVVMIAMIDTGSAPEFVYKVF